MNRLCAFGAGCLLLTAAPSALDHAGRQTPPAGQQPPVFRSGMDIVRLDVRVTGPDGRPLADIRADELEVWEGGKLRPILLFQHVQQPAGTYAEAARRTIAAEVSTNQGAPRGQVYAVVFDQAHIRPGNEQRARQAIESFPSGRRASRRPRGALPAARPRYRRWSSRATWRRSERP